MSNPIPASLRDAVAHVRPPSELAAWAVATAHKRRRRRRTLTALVTLLAVTAGALFWVSARGAKSDIVTVAPLPSATSRPSGTVISSQDRRAAPSLAGTTLTGKKVDLAADRGAVVVVTFFGSWCAPCRLQLPTINEVALGYGDPAQVQKSNGVAFIAVATRDTRQNTAAFVSSRHITVPVVLDEAGTLASAWVQGGPPVTFVIDRQGRTAAEFRGNQSDPTMRSAINTVVSEDSYATPEVAVATEHLSLQDGQFSLDPPAPNQAPTDVTTAWQATVARQPGSPCAGARRTVVTFGLFTGYTYVKRPEWLLRCEDVEIVGHGGAACLAEEPCNRPTAIPRELGDMLWVVDPATGKGLIGFSDNPS